MRLKGKVVIVTGGAQGLGRAYCESLAEEGASVVVADIRDTMPAAEGIKQKGGTAIALKTDITNEDDVLHMADEAVNAYGRIDALVNNAAVFSGLGRNPFWEIAPTDWDTVMKVNIIKK